MLEPMKDLLVEAKRGGYAVPAPNVFDKESVEAAFSAAEELDSPVILDVGYAMGIEETGMIAKYYGTKHPRIPWALNLDHGGPFEHVILAIRSGYSSVMVDRSTLSFEDNVAQVADVVRIAHAVGVSVEAELGHVGQGVEYEATRDAGLTHPEEAAEFVERTGVDCLAVAVGTSHGVYKGTPHLKFDLLSTLASDLEIPLVLHGGSGTGDENLRRAVKTGIQKVNLYTDLGEAWLQALKREIAIHEGTAEEVTEDEFKNAKKKITQLMEDSCKNGYQKKLMHYMELFDSAGRI